MTIFAATWWDSLSVVLKILYGIAFVSTGVMLLQTALSLLGIGDGDADIGGDFDAPADGDGHHGDAGVLSIRTIVAFMMGFGWVGALLLEAGWGLILVLPLAFIAGASFMYLIFWLMKSLSKLKESGTLDFINAVGEVGTVYLTIPPNREKSGQIEVMIQGRLMVVDAFSTADAPLANQSRALVIDTVGENALLVQPVD